MLALVMEAANVCCFFGNGADAPDDEEQLAELSALFNDGNLSCAAA